jgi:hypothetical protein
MKIFVGIVIAIVSAVIIAGFFVAGSPKDARLKKFDDIRIQHLQTIQSELISFWQAKQRLPERLDELNDSLRGFAVPIDPVSSASYEYERSGDTQFSLCATFAGPSDGVEAGLSAQAGYPKYAPRPLYPAGEYGAAYPLLDGGFNWEHDAGRVCFLRTIDPDFFTPKSAP